MTGSARLKRHFGLKLSLLVNGLFFVTGIANFNTDKLKPKEKKS